MMEAKEVVFCYNSYIKTAAKYYHEAGWLFKYFKGMVHAYGHVLDYKHERVEKDIANAIEQAKGNQHE